MTERERGEETAGSDGHIGRCVHAVCRTPIVFMARGNISMVRLIQESGYSALADDITEAVLEEHLRHHPDLVAAWALYSEDQRCSPALALLRPNAAARDWRVQNWDHNPANRWERAFPDQFTACAFFIKRHADFLVAIG